MEGGIQEKHLRDFTDAAHGGGRRIYVCIWSGVWRSQPPPPWYGLVRGGGRGAGVCGEGAGRWGCSWRNGRASQTRPA